MREMVWGKTAEETAVNVIISNLCLIFCHFKLQSLCQTEVGKSLLYIRLWELQAPGSHSLMFVDYFQLHDHKVINRLEQSWEM